MQEKQTDGLRQAGRLPLVIFGAGGHGRVCADIAVAAGLSVQGFCDSGMNEGERVNGLAVIAGSLAALRALARPGEAVVFIAIGNNDKRLALLAGAAALNYDIATLIHPSAIVSPSAQIGPGTVLMPGTIVNANSTIGRACIVNTGASLDHDNHLADGVQICPGCRAAGNVSFGGSSFVGTGALIIPGVEIGANAIVGAGAVVIRDVAAGQCVVGNPAQPINV